MSTVPVVVPRRCEANEVVDSLGVEELGPFLWRSFGDAIITVCAGGSHRSQALEIDNVDPTFVVDIVFFIQN